MYVSPDALEKRASELRSLARRAGRLPPPDDELGPAETPVATIALLARRLGIDIVTALDTERPLHAPVGRLGDGSAARLSRT